VALTSPTFRRVHAAAPLKRLRRPARRGRHPAFRRVHAAAPLKPIFGAVFVQCLIPAFRRVHAAAPLKRGLGGHALRVTRSIPPCSRGGPIEVGSGRAEAPARAPFRRVHAAACRDGGSGTFGGRAGSIPPCSRGGLSVVELKAADNPEPPRRAKPTVVLRRSGAYTQRAKKS
jgi:hypothetical protein